MAKNEDQDLKHLYSQGIQIWSRSQEVLEEEALKELEILVDENHQDNKESGITDVEIKFDQKIHEDSPSTSSCTAAESDFTYNLHDYYEDEEDEEEPIEDPGSDYIPSDEEYRQETNIALSKPKIQKKTQSKKKSSPRLIKVTDDALEKNYKSRLDSYYKRLEKELELLGVQNETKKPYKKLKGGLKVPTEIWNRLYEYQKEGVYWLWELHQRCSGGLLGDEMGLGKTVQIIVFLHALQYSQYTSKHGRFIGVGPTIIVCPATVIQQWVKHFHEWTPEFRIVVLHQSGSYQGQKSKLINAANKNKSIIITSYAGILKYKGNICEYHWQYLILDEGHKIRNPSSQVTVAVKEIRTPHRIMLTGSPMQNNLTELWSLFDFTNPGMLGSLKIFTEHFATPILQGGFTNATPMQEATAYSVASTLKNIISPFFLRRMKEEVKEHIQLPNKSEQVLFCSLTDCQRDLYKDYLMSEQVNNVLGRGIKNWKSDNAMKGNILMAITALRKICNHPDLLVHEEDEPINEYKKSGKMVVVSALLKIWKKQGHRTLLFSQGRSMIKIFENFLDKQGYAYLKMDGTTSISSRQGLIDKFNQDKSYDVFLLTTRVGGLGVNLIGANRVIIYDPDWNPATDTQARERAWRIGQEKSVTIYRLLCAGTVEEKMYQRQVWKQLLSNKILIDPTTNKFFKSSDLFDLFSMPEDPQANPETANIFRESRVKIQEKIEEKKRLKKEKKKKDIVVTEEKVEFSADKIQAMKNLAQQIARNISKSNETVLPKKEAYQLQLEEERKKKLEEKQKLKQLTPQELFEYNRWKAAQREEETINKMDDKVSNVSFEEALEKSSKTAELYHKLTNKDIKSLIPGPSTSNNDQKSRKRKKGASIDTSGKIDGEQVEGLLKRETKKLKYDETSNENRDNFILEHLFSKKGVSGALEHDSVLNGGKKQQSLKVRTDADERALKSLEALKKSRLNHWKW
ncbi:unnamed protein product [Ceutorhynchus assimilis]|uniref:DNA repair and recombination protein RAD54-like n=1 Tax=Ceutorhynchus assimilis TaxID=467358 RepID=A0A9N9MJ75_9CUCU|nr:unnamed protein product [Ceutorhynchus assimilis]